MQHLREQESRVLSPRLTEFGGAWGPRSQGFKNVVAIRRSVLFSGPTEPRWLFSSLSQLENGNDADHQSPPPPWQKQTTTGGPESVLSPRTRWLTFPHVTHLSDFMILMLSMSGSLFCQLSGCTTPRCQQTEVSSTRHPQHDTSKSLDAASRY